MRVKKLFAVLTIAAVGAVAAAAVGVAAPRQPMALAAVGDSFAAPYDVVWDATLRSLGVVKTRVVDKGTGRIETEPFSFAYNVGGRNGGTQVIWVSFNIQVVRAADNRTELQVTPLIHDSLLSGFTPGPTNNPWQDLFARIRTQLGSRA